MKTKKVVAVILCVLMLFSANAAAVFAQDSSKSSVTVSFVDNGVRVKGDEGDFPTAVGVLIPAVTVELLENDTVASVTVRALEKLGVDSKHGGTVASGYYLRQIKNFYCEALGENVAEFGELHSGKMSGWMFTLNNWFADMGASDITVEEGDIICWRNSCQYGADIGCDWTKPSAEITGLNLSTGEASLSPAFSSEITEYTLTVSADTEAIQVEALQENYWARVTYICEGKAYKLLRDIPAVNGTDIVIESSYCAYAGSEPSDTDSVVLHIVKAAADDNSGEKTFWQKIVDFFKSIIEFFKNIFKGK